MMAEYLVVLKDVLRDVMKVGCLGEMMVVWLVAHLVY